MRTEPLVLFDTELIAEIRKLTPLDPILTSRLALASADNQGSFAEADRVLYNKGRIVVPTDSALRMDIFRSRHKAKTAGHPGRSCTLVLVQKSFVWRRMKKFFNQYVDGCDSCLRVKSSTQKPFGTLEPLPIPTGPWTDVSYNLITDLPESRLCDSILTVVECLKKWHPSSHVGNP